MNLSLHFTTFLLLLTVNLSAQEESLWFDRAPSTEFHLNLTNSLTTIFKIPLNQALLSPYQITIKNGNKHAFKFSGAINYLNRTSDIAAGKFSLKQGAYRSRFGYEKRTVMARKFALFYGLDFVVNYFSEKSTSGNSSGPTFEIRENTFQIGMGPALGIMYHINKNISVSTEAFAYLIYSSTKGNEPAPMGGSRNFTELSTSLQPVLPFSIYLGFKF